MLESDKPKNSKHYILRALEIVQVLFMIFLNDFC